MFFIYALLISVDLMLFVSKFYFAGNQDSLFKLTAGLAFISTWGGVTNVVP